MRSAPGTVRYVRPLRSHLRGARFRATARPSPAAPDGYNTPSRFAHGSPNVLIIFVPPKKTDAFFPLPKTICPYNELKNNRIAKQKNTPDRADRFPGPRTIPPFEGAGIGALSP